VALVRPAQGSESSVAVISAPGIVTGFFSYPGECAVVRAEQSGRLSIKVMRQTVSASMDANFRLEPLSDAQRVASMTSPVGSSGSLAAPASDASSGSRFKLLAHVARRGDVEVASGDWIAGPASPAAIEGLAVGGGLPSGVQIEIQPLVATNPPRWLDWAPMGSFAGTRRRALPLAGLRLRLIGDGASCFVLSADALFLGSAILSKRGREVELVGAAGGDPLVGLRLDMAPVEAAVVSREAVPYGVVASAAVAERRSESRVRVFRAASN